MRHVAQDLRSGVTSVESAPRPATSPRSLLVRSRATLISAGTERMLVEFGKASFIGKARSQPDKVKQVLDKLRTDGVLPTMEAVFAKLGEPLPLGYCNAGVVEEAGPRVVGLQPGDRVASNAPHAEFAAVPVNLCAKIPDNVTDDQASFTVLGSIALQGVRLVRPELGERVVVVGLGLIGLVTVQLLRASGCEVLGVDLHPGRLEMAKRFGARVVPSGGDAAATASAWTSGKGVDAVIVTASAKTDQIMHDAATMCRKRGRIVLVGVVGLQLRRADFYEKELSFQVSCSYGPGRYDESYEQGGEDYPFGFVRWTEQRNFEAVLAMLASGRLVVDDLITHRFALDRAPEAYEKVSSDPDALGIILQYPNDADSSHQLLLQERSAPSARGRVAVVGAGGFAKGILVPAITKTEATLRAICDAKGGAAAYLARKHGAEQAVSDVASLLEDACTDTLFIATGHDSHAKLVCRGLEAGKHVFVEKPLAMNIEELVEVVRAAELHPDRHLMVGFNRRFSPHTQRLKKLLLGRAEPLAMSMTVNGGMIPPEHWVHHPDRGGGRIIGEACHFIDLMAFLSGSAVRKVAAFEMGEGPAVREDKMVLSMRFEDGSVGTINYFSNGSKAYPKETLEVFSDGRVARLENFRRLQGYGFKGFRVLSTLKQDKGHEAEVAAFVDRIAAGGQPVIPFTEIVNTTLATFAAIESARTERIVDLADDFHARLQTSLMQ